MAGATCEAISLTKRAEISSGMWLNELLSAVYIINSRCANQYVGHCINMTFSLVGADRLTFRFGIFALKPCVSKGQPFGMTCSLYELVPHL